MKRDSGGLDAINPVYKKQKSGANGEKPLHLRHRQPGLHSLLDNPQDKSILDRELNRAICISLYGTGFQAVKTSALESFRGAVEEYMVRFSNRVKTCMQHCRRSQPIPQDFEYALALFGLSPGELLNEHDLKVPPKVSQEPILPQPLDSIPSTFITHSFLTSSEASAGDKRRRPYIPKALPTFPSQHAYQETPLYPNRETDLIRVREQAKAEGVQAEQALRKLMVARRGQGDQNRRIRRRPPEIEKKSEDLYRSALKLLTAKDEESRKEAYDSGVWGFESSGSRSDDAAVDDFTTAVNYERQFWRRGRQR